MPVADATFLIDAKRRAASIAPVLKRVLADEEPVVVPAQAAVEYLVGTEDPSAALRDLRESFDVVPFDIELAREAARLGKEARKRAHFPGWADLQIAATASYFGMYVLTRNVRHFRDAFQLRVWDYLYDTNPPD